MKTPIWPSLVNVDSLLPVSQYGMCEVHLGQRLAAVRCIVLCQQNVAVFYRCCFGCVGPLDGIVIDSNLRVI